MSFKKITKKEWEKLGLPTNITTIYFGPYFRWNDKKKKFDKPVRVLTVNNKTKK